MTDTEEEEKIATNLTLQSKINELYTGPKFDATYSLVQVHGAMMTCIILGGIVPLFYPIAFLVLVFIYYSNKYLILNFYQKYQDFNENLVLDSSRHLLIPMFLHLIVTAIALHHSRRLRPQVYYSENNLENELTLDELKDLMARADT